MRERRYLTFDMNNPRHVEALKLLSDQSDKMRSEFVIDCILKAQQVEHMEAVIRQIISESLADITLQVLASSKTLFTPQSTENVSDLPESLVSAMDEI
jgi:hypothetical protein